MIKEGDFSPIGVGFAATAYVYEIFSSLLFNIHTGVTSVPDTRSLCADLLPENCVEEKTKSFDPNAVMAEIKHDDRPGVQLK